MTRTKKPARKGDPLIHPDLATLPKRFKAGEIRVDPAATDKPALWSDDVVPRELVPFLKAPSMPLLVDAVNAHGWLYWHPLVRSEVLWLTRLQYDERAWDHVGWSRPDAEESPEQVAEAEQALEQLVDAHAGWLLPHRNPAKAKGPKPGIENPFPARRGNELISARELYTSWHDLKMAIKLFDPDGTGLRGLQPQEYERIAREALKNSRPRWSSRRPDLRRLGADAGRRPTWQWVDDFWNVVLDPMVEWLCNENALPSFMRKEGRGARLAYAILGAVLAKDPAQAGDLALQVKNRIHAYRRSR